MAKKDKKNLREHLKNIVELIHTEIQSASEQANETATELKKQVQEVKQQLKEPVASFTEGIEALRHKEQKRLQSEYQKVIDEIRKLQEDFVSTLGLSKPKRTATKESDKVSPAPAAKKLPGNKSTAKKSTARQASAKKATVKKAAVKKTSAKKATAKKTTE